MKKLLLYLATIALLMVVQVSAYTAVKDVTFLEHVYNAFTARGTVSVADAERFNRIVEGDIADIIVKGSPCSNRFPPDVKKRLCAPLQSEIRAWYNNREAIAAYARRQAAPGAQSQQWQAAAAVPVPQLQPAALQAEREALDAQVVALVTQLSDREATLRQQRAIVGDPAERARLQQEIEQQQQLLTRIAAEQQTAAAQAATVAGQRAAIEQKLAEVKQLYQESQQEANQRQEEERLQEAAKKQAVEQLRQEESKKGQLAADEQKLAAAIAQAEQNATALDKQVKEAAKQGSAQKIITLEKTLQDRAGTIDTLDAEIADLERQLAASEQAPAPGTSGKLPPPPPPPPAPPAPAGKQPAEEKKPIPPVAPAGLLEQIQKGTTLKPVAKKESKQEVTIDTFGKLSLVDQLRYLKSLSAIQQSEFLKRVAGKDREVVRAFQAAINNDPAIKNNPEGARVLVAVRGALLNPIAPETNGGESQFDED